MNTLKTCLTLCIVVIIQSCCCDREPTDFVPIINHTESCFFPSADIKAIISECSCDSIRFYNTKLDANAPETLLAIGVKNGSDDAKGSYHLFEKMTHGQATIASIDRKVAKASCELISLKHRYAVTFSYDALNTIINTSNVEGVYFVAAVDSTNNKTLSYCGAEIKDDQVVCTGEERENEHPCPTYCGKKPKGRYLVDLPWQ